MQARSDVLREQDVAGDDRLLGDRRPAGETEFGRDAALVHLRALGEARVLRVLRDDAVERLHVLEGAAHDQRVPHAEAVVAEDAHAGAGVGHRAELGESLALLSDRDGADRLHGDVARGFAEGELLLDDSGGVGDGRGVGHREDGGVPAGGGGAGSGEDRLGCLVPGLAQVRVQVHQARQRDESVDVDHGGARTGQAGADLGDDAVVDHQVRGLAAFEASPAEEKHFVSCVAAGGSVSKGGHSSPLSSVVPASSR